MGQPLKFVDYFRHTIAPSAIEMGTSSVPLTSATNEQEWLGCYFESSGQTSYGMRIQIEKTSATAGAPRAVTLRTILGHSSGFAPQGANSVDARVTLETGNTGISGEMHAMESQCRVDAESRAVNGTYAAHKFTNNFGAENTMPTDTFFLRFYDAGTVKTPRLFGFTGLTAGTGNLYYNETLKIKVNTNDRWIPLSTAQGTYTTAYPIIGTSDTGFRYNGTLVPDADRLDYAYSMGNRAAELTVNLAAAATQNLELFQANVDLTATAGEPLSASTICLMRLRYTHDTTDMTYLRLRAINSYTLIKKEIQDAYGCIHGIDFYTNSVTINGEAAVGVFNMECNSTVTGTVRGVIINVYGDGVPSSTSVGCEVRIDGSSAGTLTEGIRIRAVGGNAITTGLKIYGSTATSITTAIQVGDDAAEAGDVIFYGNTSGDLCHWDANAATLKIQSTHTLSGSTPVNTLRINNYPTMAAGGTSRGMLVLSEALAGTEGAYLVGIAAIAEQDSTLRVHGVMSAICASLISGTDDPQTMCCVEMTYKNTGASSSSSQSYMLLREYSTGTNCCVLLNMPDHATGSADHMNLFCENGAASTCSHTLRCLVGGTPYWIMLCSTPPA